MAIEVRVRSLDPSQDLMQLRSRGGDQTGDVSCDAHAPPLLLDQDAPNTVTYTYRVTWNVSNQFLIEICNH